MSMRRLKRVGVVVGAAGTLTLLPGCASSPTSSHPPASTVQTSFPWAALPASSPGSNQVTADWQRFFSDPRLKELIRWALDGNSDLRLAVLNIEQARAQWQLREADLWPSVSASLGGSRQATAGGRLSQSTSVGLQLSGFEVDLFSRVREQNQAAALQVLATEEARKAVQASLVAAVALAYWTLHIDEAVLQAAHEVLWTREESHRLVQLRAHWGASSAQDVQLAVTLREAARQALHQARRQRAVDQHALNLLVGRPVPDHMTPGTEAIDPQWVPALDTALSSDLLLRRPDVQQAEFTLKAAQANLAAARAAFFPRISLTGSVGSVSPDLTTLLRSGTWGWSVAPQLLQSIFDAGRNQANLDLANAGRNLALTQYDKTIQTAFREAADALAVRAFWQSQVNSLTQAHEAEKERLTLGTLKFKNGTISHLDLLELQRSAIAAQVNLRQAQGNLAQSAISLYRALGGGWSSSSPL